MSDFDFELASAIVDRAQRDFKTKLTWGYLGNVYYDVDDRWWYVWFHDFPRGLDSSYPNNLCSLSLGRTDEVDAMAPAELYTRIFDRFNFLRRRLAELNEDAA